MSASFLRQQVRTWAAEVAQPGPTGTGYAFYDTINLSQNPTDAVWWSVEFASEFFEGTFCQRGYIERGFVLLEVFTQAGIGDMPGIQAMESILPALLAKVDPTQRVVLESHEPIQEASAGDASRFYRVSAVVNYRFSQ